MLEDLKKYRQCLLEKNIIKDEESLYQFFIYRPKSKYNAKSEGLSENFEYEFKSIENQLGYRLEIGAQTSLLCKQSIMDSIDNKKIIKQIEKLIKTKLNYFFTEKNIIIDEVDVSLKRKGFILPSQSFDIDCIVEFIQKYKNGCIDKNTGDFNYAGEAVFEHYFPELDYFETEILIAKLAINFYSGDRLIEKFIIDDSLNETQIERGFYSEEEALLALGLDRSIILTDINGFANELLKNGYNHIDINKYAIKENSNVLTFKVELTNEKKFENQEEKAKYKSKYI